MYTVELAPAAERAIKKLSRDIAVRILKAISKLEIEPRPSGIKKLRGHEEFYRVRVGDYRVVYEIRDNEVVVVIVRVAHRREVYR